MNNLFATFLSAITKIVVRIGESAVVDASAIAPSEILAPMSLGQLTDQKSAMQTLGVICNLWARSGRSVKGKTAIQQNSETIDGKPANTGR